MMNYGEQKIIEYKSTVRLDKIDLWYRLVNIGWLADIDLFDTMIWLV